MTQAYTIVHLSGNRAVKELYWVIVELKFDDGVSDQLAGRVIGGLMVSVIASYFKRNMVDERFLETHFRREGVEHGLTEGLVPPHITNQLKRQVNFYKIVCLSKTVSIFYVMPEC